MLNENISKLKIKLNEHGCIINIATLRNWLFDDNMIGPKNEDHLAVIAKLNEDEFLLKNIKKVKASIKLVRSYHQKAAFAIRDDLINNVSDILIKINLEKMQAVNYHELEIIPYGKVMVLKLIDIEDEKFEVDFQYANRLIFEEN